MDAAKAVPRGKFITLYIGKAEKRGEFLNQ